MRDVEKIAAYRHLVKVARDAAIAFERWKVKHQFGEREYYQAVVDEASRRPVRFDGRRTR